jgi:peptide/nickel transport system permease protein
MSTAAPVIGARPVPVAVAAPARADRGPWRLAWDRLRRHRLGLVGVATLAILVTVCVFGPLLVPYTFDQTDIRARLSPPTVRHPFGTDEVGRDALIRALYGGRVSLAVGFLVAISSAILGGVIGGICGYVGGWFDNLVMRIVDLSYSLPRVVVLLVMSKLVGPGVIGVIVILVLLEWTGVARLTRGMVLSVRHNTYVEAARSSGASPAQVLFRHVMPNALTPLIVAATLDAGAAIRAESTLSFLGLGIRPPDPSWGNLLSNASTYFFTAPWQVFFPGVLIFLALMSFNLAGDGLRDALDPRSRVR